LFSENDAWDARLGARLQAVDVPEAGRPASALLSEALGVDPGLETAVRVKKPRQTKNLGPQGLYQGL